MSKFFCEFMMQDLIVNDHKVFHHEKDCSKIEIKINLNWWFTQMAFYNFTISNFSDTV